MDRQSLRRWLAPVLLPTLVGCVGSRADTELVEARLRDHQDLVVRYEKLLDANEQELLLARRESDLLRTQIAAANASPLLPEHADVLLRAEKLAFHQMMTGTRDIDGRPGDEALNVVLMPQSHDGETVRLIGDLEIEALDLSRPEGEQRVGRWTFSAEQARELWHSGFLASGFQLDVPWELRTAGPDVLLHARLTAPDGRQFDASHQVHVDLPVIQTAATSDGSPPQIEPRRIAMPGTAEPIDIALMPPEELAPLESITRPRMALDPPETASSAAPLAPSRAIAVNSTDSSNDGASAADPPPFPAGDGQLIADPQVGPYPGSEVAGNQSAVPMADPPTTALPQMTARPVPENPFEIAPQDAPAPAQVETVPGFPAPPSTSEAESTNVAAAFPDIQPAIPTRTASTAIVPPPYSVPARLSAEETAGLPTSEAPATGQLEPLPGKPVNGITIQPLSPPRRYLRGDPSPTSTPDDALPAPQSALRPDTPFPSPEAQPVPAAPPGAPPFPVDVTPPTARPVIQSSVNWTDESIPYLR